MVVDIYLHGDQSMVYFIPNSEIGDRWVEDNLPLEDWQWIGRGFAVERRFAHDIYDGMVDYGLNVEAIEL